MRKYHKGARDARVLLIGLGAIAIRVRIIAACDLDVITRSEMENETSDMSVCEGEERGEGIYVATWITSARTI